MRKIIATLIAVFVLLASLPIMTSAADVSDRTDFMTALNGSSPITIKLSNDIMFHNGISLGDGKTITIDLNGHNIHFSNASFTVSNCTLTITGKGSIIKSTKTVVPSSPVVIRGSETDVANYTNVTVGPEVTLDGEYGLMIEGTGSEKHAYGVQVTIAGTVPSLYVDNSIKDTTGNVPVITINSPASIFSNPASKTNRFGIYAGGYAIWNINGGTITGVDAGIEVRAGKFNITGGTISATGAKDNGSIGNENTWGAAIRISSSDVSAGNIALSISGTPTITSQQSAAILEYNVRGETTQVKSLTIAGGSIQSPDGELPIVFSSQLVAAAAAGQCVLSFTGGTVSPAQTSIPGFARLPQENVETVPAPTIPADTTDPYAGYTPSENAPALGGSAFSTLDDSDVPNAAAEAVNGDSNPNTGVMTLPALPFLGLLLAGAVLTRKHR